MKWLNLILCLALAIQARAQGVNDLKVVRHYGLEHGLQDSMALYVNQDPLTGEIYVGDKNALGKIINDSVKTLLKSRNVGGSIIGWPINIQFTQDKIYVLSQASITTYDRLQQKWQTKKPYLSDIIRSKFQVAITFLNSFVLDPPYYLWATSGIWTKRSTKEGGLLWLDLKNLSVVKFYTRGLENFPTRFAFDVLIQKKDGQKFIWTATDSGIWVLDEKNDEWTVIDSTLDMGFSKLNWSRDSTKVYATALRGKPWVGPGLWIINIETKEILLNTGAPGPIAPSSGCVSAVEDKNGDLFVGHVIDIGGYYVVDKYPSGMFWRKHQDVWYQLDYDLTWITKSLKGDRPHPFGGVIHIMVDNDNRKWLATLNGIYVLSDAPKVAPQAPALTSVKIDTSTLYSTGGRDLGLKTEISWRVSLAKNLTLGYRVEKQDNQAQIETLIQGYLAGQSGQNADTSYYFSLIDITPKRLFPLTFKLTFWACRDSLSQDSLDISRKIVWQDKVQLESLNPPPTILPTEYELLPLYPNPFNPTTQNRLRIELKILKSVDTLSISIYNLIGQQIDSKELFNLPAGRQTVWQWSGRDEFGHALPVGLYFCQARTRAWQKTRKFILIK